MIKDPELIKQITVKDFDHFVNHQKLISEDIDPMFGKNLTALTDQKWKDMRATLSPSFTSSKMKTMFTLISESAHDFVEYFKKNQNQDVITIEMKDTFTRFTNDVIATTAFGIKVDSLKDTTNEFYVMGKKMTDFGTFWNTMKIFGYMALPGLLKVKLWSQLVLYFIFYLHCSC